MTRIRAFDALFTGALALSREDDGLRPWRLPVEAALLFPSPDDGLIARSGSPSGVRLRFATDSPRVAVKLRADAPPEEPAVVDLTRDEAIVGSAPAGPGSTILTFDVGPAGESTYELWLPQFHPVAVEWMEIEDGSTIAIPADDRPRWTAYGSSITMCRQAHSPARTWPAVAARRLGLNLTSMGYGGQCHLDPMVARAIRDRPADLITLKLGINVYGGSTLNARTYPAAVVGLVQTIRDVHRTTPIGVVTSIVSPARERTPNAVGCTLEDYREMTRDAVRRLQESGDASLELFEGTSLFSDADAEHLPDGLHPDGDGYQLMGERAAGRILPSLLRSSA